MREIRIVSDPCERVAQLLVEAAGVGANIVLAGGETPREAYELASEADVDWSEATLWFGDERCVEPDHSDSNYGMVSEVLTSGIGKDRRPRVKRIEGELGPEIAAANYETELRTELGNTPRMDLVILGLGRDGHTASLFPGKPAVKERRKFVAAVPQPGMPPHVPRVTLTLPVINAARNIVFLIKGDKKAQAVALAFDEQSNEQTPASFVRPVDGDITVFADELAANELVKRQECLSE